MQHYSGPNRRAIKTILREGEGLDPMKNQCIEPLFQEAETEAGQEGRYKGLGTETGSWK